MSTERTATAAGSADVKNVATYQQQPPSDVDRTTVKSFFEHIPDSRKRTATKKEVRDRFFAQIRRQPSDPPRSAKDKKRTNWRCLDCGEAHVDLHPSLYHLLNGAPHAQAPLLN